MDQGGKGRSARSRWGWPARRGEPLRAGPLAHFGRVATSLTNQKRSSRHMAMHHIAALRGLLVVRSGGPLLGLPRVRW